MSGKELATMSQLYETWDFEALRALQHKQAEWSKEQAELDAERVRLNDKLEDVLNLSKDETRKQLALLEERVRDLAREQLEFVKSTSLVKYVSNTENREISLSDSILEQLPLAKEFAYRIDRIFPVKVGIVLQKFSGKTGNFSQKIGKIADRLIFVGPRGQYLGEVGKETRKNVLAKFFCFPQRNFPETAMDAFLKLPSLKVKQIRYLLRIEREFSRITVTLYVLPSEYKCWSEFFTVAYEVETKRIEEANREKREAALKLLQPSES